MQVAVTIRRGTTRRPRSRDPSPPHSANCVLNDGTAPGADPFCRRPPGRIVGPMVSSHNSAMCPVAISRTHPAMPDYKEVAEIERLFVELIRSARTTIYAESQYFASRVIALAIAERLEDAGGPEIVIINPLTAKGWIEPMVMDTARGRFVEALRRRDCNDRFRIYHPLHQKWGAHLCPCEDHGGRQPDFADRILRT